MARIRSSRWWGGLTAVLAAAFLGTVAILIVWDWPHPADREPEPTIIYVTASPEPTAVVHPAPLAAQPLTLDVLRSVDDGWILVQYDSSAGRYGPPDGGDPTPTASPGSTPAQTGESVWEIPGPTYLYAVDPSGTAYQAAGLETGTELRLVLWLPDLRTAIVEQPVGAGQMLRTVDLVTGTVSDPLPGPGGESSGIWIDPDPRAARDGEGMWISYRDGAGGWGLTLVEFDGTPQKTLVSAAGLSGYIESSDGSTLVTVETTPDGRSTVVSYSDPGTSIFPEPTATGDPEPSPSGTGPPPDEYERVAHGMPPGESNCSPASWPEGRQLLVVCTSANGSRVVYTLALLSSTFVDVASYRRTEGNDRILFNGDGSRIARGASVMTAVGVATWTAPENESRPIGLLWAGDLLVSWGDTESPPDVGHGVSTITARLSSWGDLAYVLRANRGASGFHAVVAAPAVS